MAVEVRVDQVTLLGAEEQYGVMVGLRRQAIISGLPHILEDYTVLFEALDVIGLSSGVFLKDRFGQQTDLVLVGRNPELIPGEQDKVAVELVYGHRDNEGQWLAKGTAIGGSTYDDALGRSTSSAHQITRTTYPDDYGEAYGSVPGDGDKRELQGKPIEVRHTWPDGSNTYKDNADVALPEDPDPDRHNRTDVEGVDATDTEIHEIATIDGIFAESTAFTLRAWRKNILGKVNSATWNEGEPRTWMCTTVTSRWHNRVSPLKQAMVHMEFEYKESGWDETHTFTDPRTGRPPAGLKAAGRITPQIAKEFDFAKYLEFLTF